MGLAASQARLLTITARLSDNELRSQTINNAKMRLATQSSQASEDYVNALNNATMKFTNYALDGQSQTQNLTFNALTAYSSYNNQYGLVNSSGQLLVSETEAALYEKADGNLNTYLQYHGLNYETTYYENVGNITNDGYIEPFNYITVEDMKTYFEQYNSYENSQEVETYEKAYNTYVSSVSSLENVAKTVMSSYFVNNVNVPQVENAGGIYSMNYTSGNLAGMYAELQNAFNNSNNTFAFNNQIIADLGLEDSSDPNEPSALDNYRELLNSLSINADGSYNSTADCQLTEINDGSAGENTKVYQLDDGVRFIVDTTTNTVTSIEAVDATTTEITSSTTGGSLTNAINSLQVSFKDDDGNVTETATYGVNGTDENGIPNDIRVNGVNSAPATKEEAANIVNEILTEILKSMESDFGIEFAQALFDPDNANAAANRTYYESLGFKLSDPVKGSTKTLQEYYNEYVNAESVYFNTVFSADSVDHVKNDIDNGFASTFTYEDGTPVEITYQDLTNVDFVLRYMAAEGLNPSETFLTVVKEFVVDQIIDEYGTPKYAWIDSTDPDNTGNADAKAQWYTNLFNRMQQGYKALENGLASSTEWMEFALESGIVTMEQVDATYTWQGLDYKSCARITEETDDAAIAKAEAEYSRAMNDIEAKDNIYDLELKNIDTEHTSLQTEYDSIQQVITKNISRTFNFYQNA